MDVTFTKLSGGRYRMTVVREHGPELAPRQGLLASPLVERILARLDEFARRWHALPIDGSLTERWTLRT